MDYFLECERGGGPFRSLSFLVSPKMASYLELTASQAVYSERRADSRGLGSQVRYLIIKRQAVAT